MNNWRDVLTLATELELDEATGGLKANGQYLTDKNGLTPYGRAHFIQELKAVAAAISAAQDEIRTFEALVTQAEDEDRRLLRIRILDKARSDYAALLEYKRGSERYLAQFADAVDLQEYLA